LKSNNICSLTDYSNGSEVPPTLFNDTKGDGKYQGKQESMDILSVGIDIINDGAWLAIKTEGTPPPDALYTINMNMFNTVGTERVEINVQNGSAQLKREINGNYTTANIPLIVRNNSING
jgi:hypothetical protein